MIEGIIRNHVMETKEIGGQLMKGETIKVKELKEAKELKEVKELKELKEKEITFLSQSLFKEMIREAGLPRTTKVAAIAGKKKLLKLKDTQVKAPRASLRIWRV